MRAVTIDSDLATLFTFTPRKPPITPIQEVLECRKRRTSCFPHMALAPRSVGAASGTDAGRCLAGSLGAARLPTRRRAAMAQPQRLPLLGSRPGAAEIGAPSHRLQHPRGTAVLPTPSRPANTIGRAVVKAAPLKCRRRRAVPLSDVRRPARLAAKIDRIFVSRREDMVPSLTTRPSIL